MTAEFGQFDNIMSQKHSNRKLSHIAAHWHVLTVTYLNYTNTELASKFL